MTLDLSALTGNVVTGTNGCLGTHILTALLTRAHIPPGRIHALSLHDPAPEKRIHEIAYHTVDTADAPAVSAALAHAAPQLVIHTAGLDAFLGQAHDYMRVNVDGTRNLLCAAQKNGVKGFVFTSSASVIDDGYSHFINVDESRALLTQAQCNESYNWSKVLSETLVLAENGRRGTMTAALRVSALFGAGDKNGTRRQIDAAREGKLVYQIGDDECLVSMVCAENAADCHLLAGQALLDAHARARAGSDGQVEGTSANTATSKGSDTGTGSDESPRARTTTTTDETRVDGEAFFLTNDEPMGFWALSRKMGAYAGFPTDAHKIWIIPTSIALTGARIVDWLIWITSFGRKKGEVRKTLGYTCRWRTYSIEKARRRLGYVPAVSLDEGLRRTGEAYAALVRG